jgi:hypothetical protein
MILFMKIIYLLVLLFTFNSFAIDAAFFDILPGKLHSGGYLRSDLLDINDAQQTMKVKLQYEVIKRPLVPVPNEYLKGEEVQVLPLEFLDERGYLELEIKGTRELVDAWLKHQGRVEIAGLKDIHFVKIIAKNGRSEIDVYFHPTVEELGWVFLRLTLHTEIPLLRHYALEAKLRN